MKKIIIILVIIILVLIGAYVYWKMQKDQGPSEQTTIEYSDAVVDEVTLTTGSSYPLTLTVTAKGNLPDGCTTISDMTYEKTGDTFYVTVTQARDSSKMCTQALVPYERSLAILVEALPLGTYIVDVNGVRKEYLLEVGAKL
mgnify:FL=1